MAKGARAASRPARCRFRSASGVVVALSLAAAPLPLAAAAAPAAANPAGARTDAPTDAPHASLPRRTFRQAAATFFDDGAYLFTFPKRINQKGAWLTAGFVSGTVLLVGVDDEIRAHVLEEPDSAAAGSLAGVLEPLGRSYVEAAALGIAWAAARCGGKPRAVSTTATAFEAWLWTFVITSGAKAVFGREAPTGDFEADDFFTGGTIFPSGHTSRSFAIAAVLADRHGRTAAFIAYPAAALIGLATVQQDTHWTSDIIAGAGLGLAIGKGIAHRHPAPRDGEARRDRPGAAWGVVPAAGGARLRVTF